MPAANGVRTVLFDLDGTLADTAPDLVYAVNCVLEEEGRRPLTLEALRPTVSLGGNAMLEYAFGEGEDHPRFAARRERFLAVYRDNVATRTHLFPGMAQVLEALEAQGRNWGIVTNKTSWLTEPLVAALNLTERAACVVSGDTLERAKPHPAPLFYACERAGTDPRHCVFVGDAPKDIEAGRRAGMRTLVALFGYLPRDQDPADWGADGVLETPESLLGWLEDR